MRKQIGIVGNLSGDVFGVGVKYMQFASQFGDVHILTQDSPIMDLDLLILKGGADIPPSSYGGLLGYLIYRGDPTLEAFDKDKLPFYIKQGTPIFGICRGMQYLNVLFGGDLKQHIWLHPMSSKDQRDELVHTVYGENILSFKVNSFHHQAVAKVPNCFKITLKSSDCVEAIRHKTLHISCVQWHPEEINDKYSIGEVNRLLGVDNL